MQIPHFCTNSLPYPSKNNNLLTSKIDAFPVVVIVCLTLDVIAAVQSRRLVWLESEGIYLAPDPAGFIIGEFKVFQKHSGEMLRPWHNTPEGDFAADLKIVIYWINLRLV